MRNQIEELFKRINQKERTILYGLSDSQRSYIISLISRSTGKPQLIVTPDSTSAGKLYEDLNFFLPNNHVYIHPIDEVLPYELTAHSSELTAQIKM